MKNTSVDIFYAKFLRKEGNSVFLLCHIRDGIFQERKFDSLMLEGLNMNDYIKIKTISKPRERRFLYSNITLQMEINYVDAIFSKEEKHDYFSGAKGSAFFNTKNKIE